MEVSWGAALLLVFGLLVVLLVARRTGASSGEGYCNGPFCSSNFPSYGLLAIQGPLYLTERIRNGRPGTYAAYLNRTDAAPRATWHTSSPAPAGVLPDIRGWYVFYPDKGITEGMAIGQMVEEQMPVDQNVLANPAVSAAVIELATLDVLGGKTR